MSSTSSDSRTETVLRERNLLFLTTPALWPEWPFLPLVRRTAQGMDLGLIYDCFTRGGRTGFAATVFRCNLFMLPPTEEAFLSLPRETFDTPEELYAAGWRVD